MSELEQFLSGDQEIVEVRIKSLLGSGPREAGARMYVTRVAVHGTIGGGQMEYMAIDQARRVLASRSEANEQDVQLGPETGQCCGGRVVLALRRLTHSEKQDAIKRDAEMRAAQPEVLIFGAGHVGRALARALMPLPVRPVLIDSRSEALTHAVQGVETRLTALPEAEIRTARRGSAIVIMTHDHALDFLLAAEALDRVDAAYVGMIGSETKRAVFENWSRRHEAHLKTERLICPMADMHRNDKRPEVIAAFIAAEVLEAVLQAEGILQRTEMALDG